jgi:hypothetical protein
MQSKVKMKVIVVRIRTTTRLTTFVDCVHENDSAIHSDARFNENPTTSFTSSVTCWWCQDLTSSFFGLRVMALDWKGRLDCVCIRTLSEAKLSK